MKNLMILLTIALFNFSAGAQSILQVNEQVANISFISGGDHSGACITLNIENVTDKIQNIKIEPGIELTHEDSNYQDHILVDDIMIVLQANEKKKIMLNALCTQQRKRCPRTGSQFTLKPKTNKLRTDLAQLIAQTKQTDYAGQQAMWALINKSTPNYIKGEDSSAVMQLRHYVGKALKLKVHPFDKNKYLLPAYEFANNLSIESQGNYYVRNINPGDTITYAIYNVTNDTITDVKTDIAMVNRFRKHNVRWHFTADELNPTEKYYLRIKVNGVVYKEWMYKFMS